jgi:hypothetical protein
MTMTRSWTVNRRIAAGFAVLVGLCLAAGAASLWTVGALVGESQNMSQENAELTRAAQLEAATQAEVAAGRGFLQTRDTQLLEALRRANEDGDARIQQALAGASSSESRSLVQQAQQAMKDHDAAVESILKSLGPAGVAEKSGELLIRVEAPKVEAVQRALKAYSQYEERTLVEASERFRATSGRARLLAGLIAVVSLLTGGATGMLLTRSLTRDIGAAVRHVQSSSTELQAAANQQATASKEQAAATNETTTTIRELVATARQIAESAQRVAQIADQAATAARQGQQTVQRAQEALGGIKRQVDLIVSHMLELGRKSQQIGGILEIINELSEQTNILAINATIEAAGAGDGGKRFAAVADEIRKLADRVGGSTKDIRRLIEEIPSAVNTTVMATEQGTKAVESGARQVSDVASAFSQIAEMVATTTEAAREIELSTKQQTTAVEQVNVAMLNVSQAAKETEATSAETLQTASQLTSLSRDLTRMIQSNGQL